MSESNSITKIRKEISLKMFGRNDFIITDEIDFILKKRIKVLLKTSFLHGKNDMFQSHFNEWLEGVLK